MNRLSAWTQSLGLNRKGLASAATYVRNMAMLNVVGEVLGDHAVDQLEQISDNIYAMGLPSEDPPQSSGHVQLSAISNHLRSAFPAKFMVWNLSDRLYDYSFFDDQVIQFKFPGYTSPPLDMIFVICRSIDGWLRADSSNIAVIHCGPGRSRTNVTIACYLTWIGKFTSALNAIEHIFSVQKPLRRRLIPSQKRYLQYFDRIVVSGEYPSVEPLHLDRIIVNAMPVMEADGSCRPYVQIFKYAVMKHSSGRDASKVASHKPSDWVCFDIDQDLEGDIIIRARHIDKDGARITILRFTIHTGFVKDFALRLTKAELDAAFQDERFPDDFHIDLVFSKAQIDKATLSPEFFQETSQRSIATPEVVHRLSDEEKKAELSDDVDSLLSNMNIQDYDLGTMDADLLLAQLQDDALAEHDTVGDDPVEHISTDDELDVEINQLLSGS